MLAGIGGYEASVFGGSTTSSVRQFTISHLLRSLDRIELHTEFHDASGTLKSVLHANEHSLFFSATDGHDNALRFQAVSPYPISHLLGDLKEMEASPSELQLLVGENSQAQLAFLGHKLNKMRKNMGVSLDTIQVSAYENNKRISNTLGLEQVRDMANSNDVVAFETAKRLLAQSVSSKGVVTTAQNATNYVVNHEQEVVNIYHEAVLRSDGLQVLAKAKANPYDRDTGIGCALTSFGCAIGAAALFIMGAVPGVGWVAFGFSAFTTGISCLSLIGCRR